MGKNRFIFCRLPIQSKLCISAWQTAQRSTLRFLFAPSDSVSIFSSLLLPPRRSPPKAEERAPLAKETILVAASFVD